MRVRASKRSGVAVVELAFVLPLLVFLFVIGVDFARVYYHQLTVTNAARSGAMYGAQDPVKALDTEGIKKAALDDAKNLVPAATVKSTIGFDALSHPCINVTVTWSFNTVSRFPGVSSTVVLTRMVQMRIAPKQPKEI